MQHPPFQSPAPAEAIRESDVARLSFAVQLAEGLYEREEEGQGERAAAAQGVLQRSVGANYTGPAATATATADPRGLSFQPGAMLWVIQVGAAEAKGWEGGRRGGVDAARLEQPVGLR